MIDFARIKVRAGDGGQGTGSFGHIKGKRRGKADGGDGGRGGHVYFEASADLNTLEPFRFVRDYQAANGERGLSRRRRGADGRDLIIMVPVGTEIRVESLEHLTIYDLISTGQRVLVARGGEGGRGNSHLKDEFGRRPLVGEKGQEGERVEMVMELKLIADVSLIGLPNAGKSTLLSVLTSARPKIASYPFTTLEPNLGVINFMGPVKGSALALGHSLGRDQRSDVNLHEVRVNQNSKIAPSRATSPRAEQISTSATPKMLVLADIPGLIEGASQGKGLGDLFLRHIERTKILVHLIDLSDLALHPGGVGLIYQRYQVVRGELKNYSKELVKKKEIIVLNKIDLVEAELVKEVLAFFASKRKKAVAISALTGEGVDQLISKLASSV